MGPRIPYVAFEDMGKELQAKFPTGKPLNIMKTLANYPKLMTRWLVFANHVLSKSSLPPRDREIVILRIGWNCQSEYEWVRQSFWIQ